MISVDKVHHQARNEIFEMFAKSDMNYLLTIDSDMIWEPDGLELAYNLIQHPQVDIVTGIYFGKGKPHLPIIKKLDLEAGCYNVYIEWGNQPFEVDGGGMGFMLIPKYVVQAMKQPLCTWNSGFSEDLNFCLKAKKDYGFKIWADPRIRLGHIGSQIFTNLDWVQQFKPAMKSYIRETMAGTNRYLKEYYPTWREDLGIHPSQFKNINTEKYWDEIYEVEGGAKKNWRKYPEKFDFIVNELLKDIKPDVRVLELGCGVGVFAKKLKTKYPNIRYFGKDISNKAIEELNKIGLEGEAKQIPPIGQITVPQDLVIGLEFLEHLDDEPRLNTIKEVSTIIKDTGTAIFSLPDDCMGPSEVAEHRVKYTKDTFEEFLKQAFDDVTVYQKASRPSTFSPGTFNFLVAVCRNKKDDITIQKQS